MTELEDSYIHLSRDYFIFEFFKLVYYLAYFHHETEYKPGNFKLGKNTTFYGSGINTIHYCKMNFRCNIIYTNSFFSKPSFDSYFQYSIKNLTAACQMSGSTGHNCLPTYGFVFLHTLIFNEFFLWKS